MLVLVVCGYAAIDAAVAVAVVVAAPATILAVSVGVHGSSLAFTCFVPPPPNLMEYSSNSRAVAVCTERTALANS